MFYKYCEKLFPEEISNKIKAMIITAPSPNKK